MIAQLTVCTAHALTPIVVRIGVVLAYLPLVVALALGGVLVLALL